MPLLYSSTATRALGLAHPPSLWMAFEQMGFRPQYNKNVSGLLPVIWNKNSNHDPLEKAIQVQYGGGTRSRRFTWNDLKTLTSEQYHPELSKQSTWDFHSYVVLQHKDRVLGENAGSAACKLPLKTMIETLDVPELRELCLLHHIEQSTFMKRPQLLDKLSRHECDDRCQVLYCILLPSTTNSNGAIPDVEDPSLAKSMKQFTLDDLKDVIPQNVLAKFSSSFKVLSIHREPPDPDDDIVVLRNPPMALLASRSTVIGIRAFGHFHGHPIPRKSRELCMEMLSNHTCSDACPSLYFKLQPLSPKRGERTLLYDESQGPFIWEGTVEIEKDVYPPEPCTMRDVARAVQGYCHGLSSGEIEENACGVCGQLTKCKDLVPLDLNDEENELLSEPSATRKERTNSQDPVEPFPGPVVLPGVDVCCMECRTSFNNHHRPKMALANNLWLGDVPAVLKGLTLAEQTLISRVRYNRCVVRISSGHAKMVANVISFEHPTLKIHETLPIPRKDLEEVLAIIFTGINEPSEDDLKRTPVLVRRNKVKCALEWLKLNNQEYQDLNIDYATLDTYPLENVPLDVLYNKMTSEDGNVLNSAKSQFDDDEDLGTETGPCPFTVHGLTSDRFERMSTTERKAAALQHVKNGGNLMAVGHDPQPQGLYNNPSLYPKMFPWLFPYGFGGVGQQKHFKLMSRDAHLRWLLMYKDKRFQEDASFIIVAFNHQIIKQGTAGSFMLVKRNNFVSVAESIRSLNPNVLASIAERLRNGVRIIPETPQEKQCFRLLDQIEYVGGHVKGSIASKKFQRNEVWSLISFVNSPNWFLTLSFCDNKHPLCLYLADYDIEFKPEIKGFAERQHLITRNPVACARFFHYLVELFITHVCGWNKDERTKGLFGKPSAYYGTVEQQGRLTLHLHFLLWIDGAPPPQVIRDRLMADDSLFQEQLLSYLESCHIGEFMTGSMEDVQKRVPINKNRKEKGIHTILEEDLVMEDVPDEYNDPTLTLPEPPPLNICDDDCGCSHCDELVAWYDRMKHTVDDILLRSNVHRCFGRRDNGGNDKSGTVTKGKKPIPKQHATGKGCINRNGECTARFPRDVYLRSVVNLHTGHINLKKLEPWLNSVTPAITVLSRCNTDTTCLLSGTAVKATVGYVTDYLTKAWLKTHQIFSSMYDAFNKNIDLFESEEKPGNSARRMVLKIVNSLSAKMEIGAPMAALYLLGNPDRYCSHEFVTFYWKNYVTFVRNEWFALDEDTKELTSDIKTEEMCNLSLNGADSNRTAEDNENEDVRGEANVHIQQSNGFYIGKTTTDDYRYRPVQLENVNTYEWVQSAIKVKGSTTRYPDRTLGFFSFLPEHPLADTHFVACDPRRLNTMVPNFLGGSLPRKDHGDREYYCCTMLTLFRPWRTGLDLKRADETWEQAFSAYEFTPRQCELMSNFNLRYECYDAKDDFAASLKKSNDGEEVDSESDEPDFVDVGAGAGNKEDYEEVGSPSEGPSMKILALAKLESIAALKTAGWRNGDRLVQSLREQLKIPSITLDSNVLASTWNRIIKAEKMILWNRRFNAASLAKEDRERSGTGVRNDAYIVPASFLSMDYVPEQRHSAELMHNIVTKWKLNEEQEKAFRIITNHATCVGAEQLLMYLGGMGGTGKSRVIKAVSEFFNARNESYRFVLLAPTGTAAALIGGTTYHSFLSFKRDSEGSDDIGEVIERLKLVGYIFLDETSMVSCLQLCRISARCCDVLGVYEKPFGGLNVILSGDFSQLPPVGGIPLFDRDVATIKSARQKEWEQQNTIGRCIWLQFTTVVVLKENMRQIGEDEGEIAFCTALENLKYHACTDDDIALIRSRIALPGSGLSIDEGGFKNVAIITSENRDKDLFNDANSCRFAIEHGHELYDFYSVDTISGKEPKRPKVKRGKKKKVFANIKNLSSAHRLDLWSQLPHTSEQIPAKLRLCQGMLILIRYNIATDLCITRGQEGRVVGWSRKRYPGFSDRYVLDVLYIELISPPHEVKLPNLPPNIVPVTAMSETIDARLSSDKYVHISRCQVPVLPNFAMTDYSSQGKTRDFNIIDLANARKFQAAYTCLSRGTSLATTVIMRSFSNDLLRNRLDTSMKHEFRELNYLDRVTDLQYKGELPANIIQPTRWGTINRYSAWKTTNEEEAWHPAIRYLSEDEVEKKGLVSEVWKRPERGVKRTLNKDSPEKPSKKRKKRHVNTQDAVLAEVWTKPVGPLWDASDYSCAYDAWTCILHSLWQEDRTHWDAELGGMSGILAEMLEGFKGMHERDPAIEMTEVRDRWRQALRARYEGQYGRRGVEMIMLSLRLLGVNLSSGTPIRCTRCGLSERRRGIQLNPISPLTALEKYRSIKTYVEEAYKVVTVCGACGAGMKLVHTFRNFVCFAVVGIPDIELNTHVDMGETGLFRLQGIVYHGDFHFVARVIGKDGKVYSHDGMHGAYSQYDGQLGSPQMEGQKLNNYHEKAPTLAIYVRDGGFVEAARG